MSINNRLFFNLPAGFFLDGMMMLTGDAGRIYQTVDSVVRGRMMTSIVGPRGVGKTAAVRSSLRQRLDAGAVALVEPLRLTRDRMHMGDIESAIVRDLSDEPPRRSGEARSHQVRRILGEAGRDGRAILLLIDDAHVLHHSTLRSLKRLMELSWAGRAPLLSVLLVGQQDRAAAVPEVGLRTETVTLAGLSRNEITGFLRHYNDDPDSEAQVFSNDFIEVVASHPRAGNWLDLRRLVDEALAEARANGDEQLLKKHLAPAPETRPQRQAGSSKQAVDALLTEKAGQARRAA